MNHSPQKRPYVSNSKPTGGGGGIEVAADDDNVDRSDLKRRCIDYHTPSVLDITS